MAEMNPIASAKLVSAADAADFTSRRARRSARWSGRDRSAPVQHAWAHPASPTSMQTASGITARTIRTVRITVFKSPAVWAVVNRSGTSVA